MDEKRTYVSYEDFGAVGDGKHDDFPAIVAAHDYANEHSLPVKAKDGAEYYIGGKAISAKIMTDTDFGKAKFTIDDRELENRVKFCFEIVSEHKEYAPEIKEVKKGQKKIDFPHTGMTYVRVEGDSDHRVYIRKGLNMNSGSIPAEAFIVDADGNILSDINWDYPTVTAAMAKCVDDAPINVRGGIFTTIANQWICEYASHNRGFGITRSNVVVENVEHYVTGELPDHGAPYGGFFSIGKSYNVTLKNILLTPRFTYQMPSKIPGQMVPMGTYDLGLGNSIGTKLIGIKQTRDILDSKYWGLMGTNFCKDMVLEDCVISRFDAHCGVTNCSIKNCTFGFAGINLIGFGKFTVENTTVLTSPFLCFRSDYGSSFTGELEIKNCTWKPRFPNYDMRMFSALNSGDHDFGYECKMARTLTIDGFTVDDSEVEEGRKIIIFPSYDKDFSKGKPFAYKTPETITIKNFKSKSGKQIELFEDDRQFKDSKVYFD